MAATTAQELKFSADVEWAIRWNFAWDMNGDGQITITDFGLIFKWLFYAPGDWLVLIMMSSFSDVAAFFEISLLHLQSWFSLTVSAIVWYMMFGGIWGVVKDMWRS